MRNELRHIVATALGVIVFMFLLMSAIALLSSGKVFDNAVESRGESVSGSANESLLQELPRKIGPSDTLTEETLAAVVK
ncbi:hypothetical protein [Candidatus Thiosymbion oneisti]|nr:hypothetical protein [Candidatus Thiosymbion oneisti]